MNAATLYIQLSRQVLVLDSNSDDEILNEFMRQDKGFYKLRALLLCRSCRELCMEPYSSDFCNHLVCKQCIDEDQTPNPGCKWCRNKEDLTPDTHNKILIGLYKKLCAILHDIVSGSVAEPGPSPSLAKQKLLRFLNEGCSIPDIGLSGEKSELEKTSNIPRLKSSKVMENGTETNKACPPCCCTCGAAGNSEGSDKKDFSNDPVKVTAAQSSGLGIDRQQSRESPEYLSDTVSSTVPDSVPADIMMVPETLPQNKHGSNENGGLGLVKLQESHDYRQLEQEQKQKLVEKNDNNNIESSKISPSKIYKTISSMSLKERKNRNIFEKFGLALSPPLEGDQTDLETRTSGKLKRKKHFKGNIYKEKKKKSIQTELKVQPLKLNLKKINSFNNDNSYSVQYNITNGIDKFRADSNDYCSVESHSQDNVEESSNFIQESILVSDSPEPARKVKRKATFISNYAIFSDDSDVESGFYCGKRTTKTAAPKQDRETCGCGAGSNVKYFTDICKRSRCPCFSQGRACVNCKCRFCSNPFLLDDEVEEIFSDSDSSADQPLSHWLKDETEVIDVEAM